MKTQTITKLLGICTLVFSTSVMANEMSFFVTSAGPGEGANLGGLEGADAHCTKLAKTAGSKKTNWKAYLSTTPVFDRTVTPTKVTPGVSARDRIGNGPWHNAKGEIIARTLMTCTQMQASTRKPASMRKAIRSMEEAINPTDMTS